MARTLNRLNATQLARLDTGMHADGGGLYVQVSRTGAKSWVYRYMLNGRTRDKGLGPFPTVSLADARQRADRCRSLKARGIDPIAADREHQQELRLKQARAMTFKQCAQQYMAAHRASWRNAKHAAQWESTLRTYAYPVLGDLPVQDVDTALVVKVLQPIWATKTETAGRVRGRIEAVLNWAKTQGYRDGQNPAQWRGYLSNLLAAPSKLRRVRHHPALPHADLGHFIYELRQREGVAPRALEFLILTATRTNETLGARWDEVDLANGVWAIPAERMKANRVHRVPLSERAIAILEGMAAERQDEFVFPSARRGHPLSNMAFLALLKRMGRKDITAHGFRSTFRDWAAERTPHPREIVEAVLAHAVGNKVEAAYLRTDHLRKRAVLMAEWATHCDRVRGPAEVISLRQRAAA